MGVDVTHIEKKLDNVVKDKERTNSQQDTILKRIRQIKGEGDYEK